MQCRFRLVLTECFIREQKTGFQLALKFSYLGNLTNLSQIKYLCILFLTLIHNINIIHMGVTLPELRLLGRNHSTLISGIYWPQMWPFILIASLESLITNIPKY